MPKSQLDWFGIAALWFGAAVMAIKGGGLPLISGAPLWLAANWWSYVPVTLFTVYVGIALYRAASPAREKSSVPLATREPEKPDADSGTLDNRQLLQVTLALQRAKDSTRLAMGRATGSYRQREAERLLPKMKAALLSANKFYGVPMLGDDGTTAPVQLETSCRLIEQVLPYLYQGHIDEAVREGEAFLKKMAIGRV